MLITQEFYVLVTGDTTTPSADVTEAVDEATTLVGDQLDRHLVSASRVEVVAIHRDGRAYPKAAPVTVAPAGAEIDPLMGGFALRWVTPDDVTVVTGYWTQTHPPFATITYTGGYGEAFAAPPCPRPLARCIAQLAHALAVGVPVSAPAGATSVRLGDAGVTFAIPLSDLDELVPGITARLRPYRRVEYA